MIRTFRLCQDLKKIDLIWVILKESKSWEERKEGKKLNTLQKRYVYIANTNTLVNKHMTVHLTSIVLAETIITCCQMTENHNNIWIIKRLSI